MGWDAIFTLTNAIAFTGWAALAFLPRGPKVMSLILYLGVALLCLAYTIMFVGAFAGLFGPAFGNDPGLDLTNYSVDGLRALFARDAAIVIGWTHYLAFDLFVGLWIAKDADHKGFSRIAQLPFLFATLMAGPIGLFAWLLTRERRARRLAQ